jgi:hypothetical protein
LRHPSAQHADVVAHHAVMPIDDDRAVNALRENVVVHRDAETFMLLNI